MSDPVTNVEIEDVLSSIRRLVSAEPTEKDDAGRGASEEAHGDEAQADPLPQERRAEPKLVLTPAQRVNDVPPEASAEAQEQISDAAFAEDESVTADGAKNVDAAGVADDASESSADVGADASADDFVQGDAADTTVLQMVAEQVAAKVEADAVEDVRAQIAEQMGDCVDANGADEIDLGEEPIVEDQLAEDVESGPDVPAFLRRPVTQMNPPEDAEIIDDSVSFDDGSVTDTAPEAEPADAPRTLTETFETLEAAVAEQAQDWEPDGDEAETLSEDEVKPLPWTDIEDETAEMEEPAHEDAPFVDAEAPDGAEATASTEASDTPPWFGEDAVLDEDALRDMVGEIVRQELQGALGERITRNVRKLVRREINRALMSQGLD